MFDPDGLWYCTLRVRREGAQGTGSDIKFGPFTSEIEPLELYAVLHLMGWEPHFSSHKRVWERRDQ